jgi:hypothetical protein
MKTPGALNSTKNTMNARFAFAGVQNFFGLGDSGIGVVMVEPDVIRGV